MHRLLICFALLLLVPINGSSQKTEIDIKQVFRYNITEKVDEIIVDGKVEEETWKKVQIGSDFLSRPFVIRPNL